MLNRDRCSQENSTLSKYSVPLKHPMKLYYWKTKRGNVGDDLNPWLFHHLLPGLLQDQSKTSLVGIGTLINDVLVERAQAEKIAIFSTGVGYGKQHFANLPTIDDKWKIYCLRGPLSVQALGVSPKFAVTDGALLVRRLYSSDSHTKKYKFAFMPHLWQAMNGGDEWKAICEQLGFLYIDPMGTVEQVLSAISQTEVILTEAMHGAILADSIRVPWIAVHTTSDVLGFKWLDWCLSVGVKYQPYSLPKLVNPKGKKHTVQEWLHRQKVASQLAKLSQTVKPMLSDENHIENLTVELETRLDELKRDLQSGYFD